MHLMVDIETLGSNSHAPVIEIGIVQFDGAGTYTSYESKVLGDFHVSMPDLSTIQFWLRQDIPCPISTKSPLWPQVLQEIVEWLGHTEVDGVWANAPSFDLVILHNLSQAYGIEFPFHFRTWRDCRTAGKIGYNLGVDRPRPKVAHSAVYDAIAQAEWMINVDQALKGALLA